MSPLDDVSVNTRAKEIRSMLSRILASKEFSGKEKNCRLLQFLVEEKLAGQGDQLKQYTIGTGILNRPPDFNPDLDPIVRILAGRLRRSLHAYYHNEGKEDPIRIDIPKGSYIPSFIELAHTNAQEINRQKNVLNKNDIVRPAIAVEPLKNLTGDAEQDYFVQGFTQELIMELSCYEDFQVIISGDYPEKSNRHRTADVEQTGRARFIISGSVRKAKTTFKIAIQLVDAVSGEHIWGEQFRRNLTTANLLTIQEEIVHDIIANIACEYGVIPRKLYHEARKKSQPDLQTCDAIFRYYHYQRELSVETYLAAFQTLEQAVARDAECGMACAMLASLHLNAFGFDLPGSEKGPEQAADLIRQAINAEPTNQLVRLISALLHFQLNQRSEFLMEMNKAEALNPRSPLRIGGIGYFLALYGEWERGKQLLDTAMEMNANYPAWYHGVTTLYYYRQKEYEQACSEAVLYDLPDLFWTPLLRGACLGQLHRGAEAAEQISRLQTLKPDFPSKARTLIQRFVKEDDLVDHIMAGLEKAGL